MPTMPNSPKLKFTSLTIGGQNNNAIKSKNNNTQKINDNANAPYISNPTKPSFIKKNKASQLSSTQQSLNQRLSQINRNAESKESVTIMEELERDYQKLSKQ